MLTAMLPFWLSIAALSLVQGILVLVPGTLQAPAFLRLRGRWWALIPAGSVIGFVLIASAAEHASSQGLTYLALVAVPPLAALALGALARGARPAWAWLVLPLFALAWADHGGLAGECAAVVLSALSCVSLGVLLAAVTPTAWLGGGIIAMAIADTVLVVSDLLAKPNNALNAAHPAAGLPRLQSEVFGSAVMGYGDLFVAAVLGALLASSMGRPEQRLGAALTAAFALALDLLFFLINELPATVPVALALVVVVLRRRRGLSAASTGTAPGRRRSRDARARRARAAT
jgi:hypothetical protein